MNSKILVSTNPPQNFFRTLLPHPIPLIKSFLNQSTKHISTQNPSILMFAPVPKFRRNLRRYRRNIYWRCESIMTSMADRTKGFRVGCGLFCCPPCPSAIASKFAFHPPDESSYRMIPIFNKHPAPQQFSKNPELHYALLTEFEEKLERKIAAGKCTKDILETKYRFESVCPLEEPQRNVNNNNSKECVDVFFTKSSKGNRIACMYIRRANANPFTRTILYSHANACDLGNMLTTYISLASELQCNLFSYDYSGYGCSSGKSSESNLYADIKAAYKELTQRYSVLPEQIVLYGQSIGTVPTSYLARQKKYPVAGVILHSGFMSGLRVLLSPMNISFNTTWFFDVFPVIENVKKAKAPVLVIHGTNDEMIKLSHGKMLHTNCPTAVDPLWVEGAEHNDISDFPEYMVRLKKFMTVELFQNRLSDSKENIPSVSFRKSPATTRTSCGDQTSDLVGSITPSYAKSADENNNYSHSAPVLII